MGVWTESTGNPGNNLGRNGSKTHIFLTITSSSCSVFKVADDGLGKRTSRGGFGALCTSPSILGGFFIQSCPQEEVGTGGRCHPGSFPACHHAKTYAGEETRGTMGLSLLTPMCPRVPPHLGYGGDQPRRCKPTCSPSFMASPVFAGQTPPDSKACWGC